MTTIKDQSAGGTPWRVHPDLIDPLAKLIVRASGDSQVWITTHSRSLAEAIRRETGTAPILLEKVRGETRVVTDDER